MRRPCESSGAAFEVPALFAEQLHEFFRTEPRGAKGGEQDHLVESGHTREQHGTSGVHEHHGCGRFCGANEAGAAKRPKAVGPQDIAQAKHGSTLSKDRSVRCVRRFQRILCESDARGAFRQSKMQTRLGGTHPRGADVRAEGTFQFGTTTIL
jgi:hypothetical protein